MRFENASLLRKFAVKFNRMFSILETFSKQDENVDVNVYGSLGTGTRPPFSAGKNKL